MVLSISEVSEYVLSIFNDRAIIGVLNKLFKIERINQLVFSSLNFEMGLIWLFLMILSLLRLEGILRMRQHVFRNRQSILN